MQDLRQLEGGPARARLPTRRQVATGPGPGRRQPAARRSGLIGGTGTAAYYDRDLAAGRPLVKVAYSLSLAVDDLTAGDTAAVGTAADRDDSDPAADSADSVAGRRHGSRRGNLNLNFKLNLKAAAAATLNDSPSHGQRRSGGHRRDWRHDGCRPSHAVGSR